jgi:Xaa-Pro aminopeptidase
MRQSEEIQKRLTFLRKLMKENHIDAYVVPTSDSHDSEYVSDYFKMRKYLSGFTGSAGTLDRWTIFYPSSGTARRQWNYVTANGTT